MEIVKKSAEIAVEVFNLLIGDGVKTTTEKPITENSYWEIY